MDTLLFLLLPHICVTTNNWQTSEETRLPPEATLSTHPILRPDISIARCRPPTDSSVNWVGDPILRRGLARLCSGGEPLAVGPKRLSVYRTISSTPERCKSTQARGNIRLILTLLL